MIKTKIKIRFFDIGQELNTLEWPIKEIEYVEELVYDILETQGVGPIYRMLFGLKYIDKPIWLAPNYKVYELLKQNEKLYEEPFLELRMRFRPSSFTKLLVLDRTAFEIVFAQIRYDFIHTRFTNESRDFILLDNSLLGMIAADLLRYSLEHEISIDEIFKRVNPKDFIPNSAPKWQRSLLFHLREKLNLQTTLQIGFRNCDRDVLRTKQAFVELFLIDVCKDYGSETYKVICLDEPSDPRRMLIRIKYNQTKEDSFCIIETKLCSNRGSSSRTNWVELCDINSICYGSLRRDAVEINRSNGRPFRIQFDSSLHARSFLSLIDGYYRLMRKWHFNFCRDVSSPDLEHLKKIKCHGPIGYETMRTKLTRLKKPGTYSLRRCMEKNDRYLIDVILPFASRLVIDVDWNPVKKVFSKTGHSVMKAVNVEVVTDREEYHDLKALISETQIRLDGCKNQSHPLQLQLKYLIPPSEYDDCPALLVSIGKKKFKECDFEGEGRNLNSLNELPKFIPPEMLKPIKAMPPVTSRNKLMVRFATMLNGARTVIVKENIDEAALLAAQASETSSTSSRSPTTSIMERASDCSDTEEIVLIFGQRDQDQMKLFNNLKPAQNRLADWIFVKNTMFAETIGLDLTKSALIQEFFPLGRLDHFLNSQEIVSEFSKRSISCQLAQALLFLQEIRIIHGKLRCHNVYLSNLNPIQIKITDPMGTFDVRRDRAFLPPEYFGIDGDLKVPEYDSGIDIWALGTTLWQVYSRGRRPLPGRYANTLIQPPECPDEIWTVIETCWLEPNLRASPPTIYRDLNDCLAWERDIHSYDYIPQANGTNAVFDSEISSNGKPNSVKESKPLCGSSICTSSTNGEISESRGSQMNLLHSRLETSKSKNNDSKVNALSHANGLTIGITNGYSTSTLSRKFLARKWRDILFFKSGASTETDSIRSDDDYKALSSWSSVSLGSKPSLMEEITVNTTLTSLSNSSTVSKHSDSTTVCNDSSLWNIEPSHLKIGPEIGRGSCGVVKKGVVSQWGGLSEQVVAIKYIKNKDSSDFDDLKREFEILKSLDHENIVQTIGFVDDGCIKLVFEYMPLGSLLSCLRNSHQDLLLSLPLQKYALDIARGMEYLESKKIVHRDLALRNILVKNQTHVKICDFGLAQFLGTNENYKLKTYRALPLRWYAPEALKDWTFTHKTDVWSYGIVLWEMYSGGSSPQYSGTYAELPETLKHERLTMPKDCPGAMYNLMLSCWAYNPEDRDSFTEICAKLEGFPGNSQLLTNRTDSDFFSSKSASPERNGFDENRRTSSKHLVLKV